MNGITRRLVIELCKANDVPVYERDFSLTDVYDADEAFVTGTFGGLTPVIEVDGRVIGEGKLGEVSQQLQSFYRSMIEASVNH